MKRTMKTQDQRIKKEKFQRQVFPDLHPLNENQQKFMDALKYDTLVVGEGSSGVGKTMIACWWAAKKLFYGDVKKVVLIRAYQPLCWSFYWFTSRNCRGKASELLPANAGLL